MTEPTDAELITRLNEPEYYHAGNFGTPQRAIALLLGLCQEAADALKKQGRPAQAAEPVAPDFFTVCALYEGGGEAGWLPLPGYSNETEHGVKNLVLEAARKEGYKGTAAGRLLDLGWEIRPVYLTPQPVAREPLTDWDMRGQLAASLHCWHRLTPNEAAELVAFVQRVAACGIKGGQHGTDT